VTENTALYTIEKRDDGWAVFDVTTGVATPGECKILTSTAGRAIILGLAMTTIVLAGLLAPTSVRSETQQGKNLQTESQNMSSALKTFICAGEGVVPQWCQAYRAAKFSTSISDRTKARKKAIRAAEKKAAEEKKALADRKALEAKRARAAKKLAEASKSESEPELTEEELKILAEIEAEKQLKAWAQFLDGVDMKNMTIDQVIIAKEFAVSNDIPEANEFLGFAYSQDSKNLSINLSEAYRQYGQAYLKGLARVKPNMDLIWKKLTKTEQQEALREFERNQ